LLALYACLFKRQTENVPLNMEAESTRSTELYLKVTDWLYVNRKKLIIAASTVVVLAVIIGLMAWQKAQTEAAAINKLLDVPLTTIQSGQVASAQVAPFLDVAKQYPGTSAGEYAELLAAESLFLNGKYPEAHQQFSKFIDNHSDSSLLPQAKMGLAAALEGEGNTSGAAQKYQEVIMAYPTDANIISPAKLTLARLDEQLNKLDQALNYYTELARVNNPNDPWSLEARERGELLLSKHPELRKAPPAAPLPSATSVLPGLQKKTPASTTTRAPAPARPKP
jgi:predicted negative regulator of RcsB-dependent stress response